MYLHILTTKEEVEGEGEAVDAEVNSSSSKGWRKVAAERSLSHGVSHMTSAL